MIDDIKYSIITSSQIEWKNIIREHILMNKRCYLGAIVIDIYLVAFVAETYGAGREVFFKYIKGTGISDKDNSAQAIWQVGKGDGVYLNIPHSNRLVKDWDFMKKWIESK